MRRLGDFSTVCRMYPRAVLRVRDILDSDVVVHPRRCLGGTGGPVAPFRGARGGGTTPRYHVIYGPKWTFFTPLLGGSLGGSHRSLLDLPVRTDTKGYPKGGSRGLKGDPLVPIRCEACGLPLRACRCIPGVDY